MYVIFAIFFIFGAILGVILSYFLIFKNKIVGVLKVAESEEDGSYLFLELSKNGLDVIHRERYITLRVDIKKYTAQ